MKEIASPILFYRENRTFDEGAARGKRLQLQDELLGRIQPWTLAEEISSIFCLHR